MKLKPQTTILLSTLFVLAGILVTWAAGLWQTESDKTPKRLEAEVTQPGGAQVQYDPADIRGSYTFGEISNLYGIPLSDLAAAFGLTEGEAGAFEVKGLKDAYEDSKQEIGTASLRLFAAFYLGISYAPAEETYLPETALAVLAEKGKATADQLAYAKAHAVPPATP